MLLLGFIYRVEPSLQLTETTHLYSHTKTPELLNTKQAIIYRIIYPYSII